MHRFLSSLSLAVALAFGATHAQALMVGSAPDSPAAHVDANTPASPWTSAVSVIVNGTPYSGVVVAPRYVLTAAHVVGTAAASAVVVQVNAQAAPVLMNASAITRFPSASFPYDDLALITLQAPVPAEVQILPVLRQPLSASQPLTLVGYGWSGAGNTGPSQASSAHVKRSGGNVADAVWTSVDNSGRNSLFFLFDFDGPSGNGAFGGRTLGNASEVGLASGDSGSPSYAEIGGQRWLVGINSLVAAAPGDTAIDYQFGTVGGGMLLSDPRFIAWLTTQTLGTLPDPATQNGDVPLPLWAGAALFGLLGAGAARQRRRAKA